MDAPRTDAVPLDQLSRELEEAHASIALLIAENTKLCSASGEPPSVHASPPAARPKRSAGDPYRAEDRRVELERALEQASAQAANLSIDNSILQSRRGDREALVAERKRATGAALALVVAVLVPVGVLFYLAETYGGRETRRNIGSILSMIYVAVFIAVRVFRAPKKS